MIYHFFQTHMVSPNWNLSPDLCFPVNVPVGPQLELNSSGKCKRVSATLSSPYRSYNWMYWDVVTERWEGGGNGALHFLFEKDLDLTSEYQHHEYHHQQQTTRHNDLLIAWTKTPFELCQTVCIRREMHAGNPVERSLFVHIHRLCSCAHCVAWLSHTGLSRVWPWIW